MSIKEDLERYSNGTHKRSRNTHTSNVPKETPNIVGTIHTCASNQIKTNQMCSVSAPNKMQRTNWCLSISVQLSMQMLCACVCVYGADDVATWQSQMRIDTNSCESPQLTYYGVAQICIRMVRSMLMACEIGFPCLQGGARRMEETELIWMICDEVMIMKRVTVLSELTKYREIFESVREEFRERFGSCFGDSKCVCVCFHFYLNLICMNSPVNNSTQLKRHNYHTRNKHRHTIHSRTHTHTYINSIEFWLWNGTMRKKQAQLATANKTRCDELEAAQQLKRGSDILNRRHSWRVFTRHIWKRLFN